MGTHICGTGLNTVLKQASKQPHTACIRPHQHHQLHSTELIPCMVLAIPVMSCSSCLPFPSAPSLWLRLPSSLQASASVIPCHQATVSSLRGGTRCGKWELLTLTGTAQGVMHCLRYMCKPTAISWTSSRPKNIKFSPCYQYICTIVTL